jgi:hypothetical protein
VFVPENVCVTGSAHLRAGESQVAGEVSDGWDVDHDIEMSAGETPRLDLDANVDFGQLRVINSDTASVDSYRGDRGPFGRGFSENEETEPLRAAQERACAR